jgi:hypothetical protein
MLHGQVMNGRQFIEIYLYTPKPHCRSLGTRQCSGTLGWQFQQTHPKLYAKAREHQTFRYMETMGGSCSIELSNLVVLTAIFPSRYSRWCRAFYSNAPIGNFPLFPSDRAGIHSP